MDQANKNESSNLDSKNAKPRVEIEHRLVIDDEDPFSKVDRDYEESHLREITQGFKEREMLEKKAGKLSENDTHDFNDDEVEFLYQGGYENPQKVKSTPHVIPDDQKVDLEDSEVEHFRNTQRC